MTDVSLEHLEEIARQAGALVAAARERGPAWVNEKGMNDFVTETDRASEALVIRALAERYPDVPVLAEEGSGTAEGDEPEFFCVDPLDGTNNFVHGVPVVCVSVGFVRGGRPVAGAVFDPVHGELFSGAEGLGARCDGRPLKTSGKASAAGAFVATGFPFKEMGRLEYYLDGFRRILKVTGGVRRCGSAALDMCWTAAGRYDGFWELGLKPWDMAAGTAILRAAGGAVSDLDGGEGFLMGGDIVAGATPSLHGELRRLVTGG